MLESAYDFALSDSRDNRQTDASIRLRPATPADAPFAYFVKKKTLGAYIAQTWGWNEDEQVGYHRREYKPELIRIITVAGTDIGTVSVIRDGSRVLLCMLYILPEFQRRGIGSCIVRSVQARAQRDNLPVRLAALKVNPAQELYRRLGFVPVEETDTHIKMQWSPLRPNVNSAHAHDGEEHQNMNSDAGKVLVSRRNRPLLRYGSTMSFTKLPSDVQDMIRRGKVCAHVECNLQIGPNNVDSLDVKCRHFWYGHVPTDLLKERVFKDRHPCCSSHPKCSFGTFEDYHKAFMECAKRRIQDFTSRRYPVALWPAEGEQTFADGYGRFNKYVEWGLTKIPALAGVSCCAAPRS